MIYDLLECLKSFLDSAGLSTIPVYFISPAAKSSLSHSNIYAEWSGLIISTIFLISSNNSLFFSSFFSRLCDSKKAQVFIPEVPFPHNDVSVYKTIFSHSTIIPSLPIPHLLNLSNPPPPLLPSLLLSVYQQWSSETLSQHLQ